MAISVSSKDPRYSGTGSALTVGSWMTGKPNIVSGDQYRFQNTAAPNVGMYGASPIPIKPATKPKAYDPTRPLASTPQAVTAGTSPSFTPTAFNGQVYNDPASLAAAQAAKVRQFSPQYIGSDLYTDIDSYTNRLITDAQKTHSDNVKAAQKALHDGILTIDQANEIISTSRKNVATKTSDALKSIQDTSAGALNSIGAFYSASSPYGMSSNQAIRVQDLLDERQTQTDRQNEWTRQQNTTLDTQEKNNIKNRDDLVSNYVNMVGSGEAGKLGSPYVNTYLEGNPAVAGSLNTALDSTKGQINQQKLNWEQGVTDKVGQINDAALNTGIQLQEARKAYNASTAQAAANAAANVQQYNPLDLAASLQPYYMSFVNAGASPEQARAATSSQISKLKLNPAEQADFENWFYNTALTGYNFQ